MGISGYSKEGLQPFYNFSNRPRYDEKKPVKEHLTSLHISLITDSLAVYSKEFSVYSLCCKLIKLPARYRQPGNHLKIFGGHMINNTFISYTFLLTDNRYNPHECPSNFALGYSYSGKSYSFW